MQNLFRKDRYESQWQFNRERLILGAMQNVSQLCFMMDTQSEGLYQKDAQERRKEFGSNILRLPRRKSSLSNLFISYQEAVQLIDQLTHQKIAVFRRGLDSDAEINNEHLVPGDMIFVAVGEIIPADIRIVYTRELRVDQSLFTGNKEIVEKRASLDEYTCTMSSITGLPNICLMGSRIIGGLAKAVVLSTGSATYLGKLIHGNK